MTKLVEDRIENWYKKFNFPLRFSDVNLQLHENVNLHWLLAQPRKNLPQVFFIF